MLQSENSTNTLTYWPYAFKQQESNLILLFCFLPVSTEQDSVIVYNLQITNNLLMSIVALSEILSY